MAKSSKMCGSTVYYPDALDALRKAKGAQLYEPARAEDAERARAAFNLPESHLATLHVMNGADVYDGYYRLFGIGANTCRDLFWWNEYDTWRFAWSGAVDRYIPFAETVWGDQYAYERDRLSRGDETVFILDAFEMVADRVADNFADFLVKEFVRVATEPYSSKTREAHDAFGPLGCSEQLTYVPSLLLGGNESIENVAKMSARVNMIINGDVASGLVNANGKQVAGLETYLDEYGGHRIRIRWS